MAKRLAYYHPSGKEPWPSELSHKLSKFGIASFDADSEGDRFLNDEGSRDRLMEDSELFQLIVEGRSPGFPSVPGLSIVAKCEHCGGARYRGSKGFVRHSSTDLSAGLDFQQTAGFRLEDGSRVQELGPVIISARILEMLFTEKMTGLAPFLREPSVKHGVVDLI